MTWSARSITDRGIAIPKASAVARLITRSNRVGCSTGSSPGDAPITSTSDLCERTGMQPE